MAPVEKRLTISETGSTSSIGIGLAETVAEREQPAQRGQVGRLLVDHRRVLLEHLVAAAAGGVLELEDGLGVEEVVLALAAPLVLAADLELAVGPLLGAVGVGGAVTGGDLGRELVEADAAEPAGGAGEVLVDELLAEPDRLEDLRAGVRRDGRDAHLRHHLEDALAGGLDVVPDGVVEATVELTAGGHRLEGLEGHVRVDGRGAVPDEQRHVVHLAGVARLDDESRPGCGCSPGRGGGAPPR